MATPIFIVDAFTATPFAGNPAAVCLLQSNTFPDDATLLKIAAEMNLSETAFIVPRSTRDEFDLRWFTPKVEVPLCGHATLASAHVLFSHGSAAPSVSLPFAPSGEKVTFHTLSGPLPVQRVQEGKETTYQLNFPQGAPVNVKLPDILTTSFQDVVQQLCKYLPLSGPSDILNLGHCPKTRKLLVEVVDPSLIQNLAPNHAALTAVDFGGLNVKGIMVATPGGESLKDASLRKYDFISRYFAPWLGINEDPVCGSAHTALAVYYGGKLGKTKMLARQASPRGGDVVVELTEQSRVFLSGPARTVVQGELRF